MRRARDSDAHYEAGDAQRCAEDLWYPITSNGKYEMLSLLIKGSTGARLLRCFDSTRHSAFR